MDSKIELTAEMMAGVFTEAISEPFVCDKLILLIRLERSAETKKFSAEGYDLFRKKVSANWKVVKSIIELKFIENRIEVSEAQSYLANMGENKNILSGQIEMMVMKVAPFVKEKFLSSDAGGITLIKTCEYAVNHFMEQEL
jgi:hypothetical protein